MSETIDLKVVSNDTEAIVIETPDGKQKKYYRNPIRTLSLELFELQVCRSATVYHMGGEIGLLPTPTHQLRGQASLGRSKIAIIGQPNTATKVLPIIFSVLSDAQRLNTAENAEKYNQPIRYTGVNLGFIPSDWEIGNNDDWFVECHVSAEVFTEMESAISAATLKKATIGLELNDVYTDDNWAPPSVAANWFLRPNLENPKYGPDMAHGDITSFNLAMSSVWLGPPPEAKVEVDTEDEQQVDQSEPLVRPEVVALNKLGANIEKLRGTVKWVGGLIALFLCILVLKGP